MKSEDFCPSRQLRN